MVVTVQVFFRSFDFACIDGGEHQVISSYGCAVNRFLDELSQIRVQGRWQRVVEICYPLAHCCIVLIMLGIAGCTGALLVASAEIDGDVDWEYTDGLHVGKRVEVVFNVAIIAVTNFDVVVA